ncbi:MAG TPA: aminotransferase class V-fold PLP-dependent enzyme [Bryobacteraceae bacterium]|nr:aminotransferase class V-fold PLP-dependent enzyme [Bryobacteraceae bacterium]
MSVDWKTVREEFPALKNWTYLNTATFGQLSRRSTEAVVRHFAHRDELACADFLAWFDDMGRIRGKVGQLIGCEPSDVAFIPNASSGLAILLSGLKWQAGDTVVTLENEFPNNLYAPALLQTHGVTMVACPWERLHDMVQHHTRVVILSTVNYNTGFRPPLEELSRFLHDRRVLLFVDGTQSVGALKFDVREIQPDMFAVNSYKWLNGPNGAAFLYVRPELRETLPPNIVGWRSHYDWRNVDHLHHGVPEMVSTAEKYEGGMLAFALFYAMEAAIDLVLEIGGDAIEQRVMDLATRTRALLVEFGAAVNQDAAPIVAAKFENRDVSKLALDLQQKRVLVAARKGYLRVSPHFYNNEDDLEALRQGLRELLA